MKTFQQKKEELAKLKDKLAKAKIIIFTSFAREGEKGLNVGDLRTLKIGLKTADSEYVVEKKTILDKALKDTKSELDPERGREGTQRASASYGVDVFQYRGSLGTVFGYGDEQLAAKAIYNFAKKKLALKYFGAIMGGKLMDLAQFTEFAKLPSKEVMIARLLGMMQYPISALAMVLDQIKSKK